ncbi:MAG TPA: glycosyltransferase family 87 protein [Planctomycetota bacterium]|jgi:hypothetical protein|nr:glycosyltransferase family 87 protein [Planctomycetota bacterium]
MSQVLREKEGFGLPRAVLVAALAALAVKLVLATTTQGTNDIRAFWYFLQEYRGSGAKLLYEKESEFNHPPFVIRWLTALRWLHQTTGWAPWFWVRLPAILADFGSVWIVARLVRARLGEASTRFTLLLVAAAPASVMISGFHGNNDPVMIFFVLVSILLLERRAPFWLAGLAMGMAVDMKVVPLVFWPAICLWLPSWRARFEYFGAAVSAIVVASLPWIFQEPALIARKVLLYKSSYGLWGISRILKGALAFESWGRVFLAATLVGLALWMNRRPARPPLFRQLAVLAFAFLVVTPGFGVQYLAWLVPWIAGIAPGVALAWCLASGAFLFLVYTFWCQGVPFENADPNWLGATFWSRGLPWVSADANSVGEWRGPIVPVEVVCWITVVVGLVFQLRALERESSARV